MLRSGILTAALVVALGAPAAAEEQASPPKRDKKVCKTVGDTQWRTSRSRVCKTKAEWDAIMRETQKEYQDYGRTGSQGDLNGN